METVFAIPSNAGQVFLLSFRCRNANNAYNGDLMTLGISTSGLFLWDNSTSTTLWSK